MNAITCFRCYTYDHNHAVCSNIAECATTSKYQVSFLTRITNTITMAMPTTINTALHIPQPGSNPVIHSCNITIVHNRFYEQLRGNLNVYVEIYDYIRNIIPDGSALGIVTGASPALSAPHNTNNVSSNSNNTHNVSSNSNNTHNVSSNNTSNSG